MFCREGARARAQVGSSRERWERGGKKRRKWQWRGWFRIHM